MKAQPKTTIKTNKAILYFYDLEQQQFRRVLFGDPEELYDFFVAQSAIMHDRLLKVSGAYKSKKALNKAIEESKEEWVTDNAHGALDDTEVLEFSYKFVKG